MYYTCSKCDQLSKGTPPIEHGVIHITGIFTNKKNTSEKCKGVWVEITKAGYYRLDFIHLYQELLPDEDSVDTFIERLDKLIDVYKE